MQVVVRTPHTNFKIDGDIQPDLIEILKDKYGDGFKLIENEDEQYVNIKETEWFMHFDEIEDKRITKAIKDLKKHLGISAQRDGEFVVISMTCGDKKESALIVNEMINLFLNIHGSSTKEELDEEIQIARRIG